MQGSEPGAGVGFSLAVALSEPASWCLAELILATNDGKTDSRTQVRSAH